MTNYPWEVQHTRAQPAPLKMSSLGEVTFRVYTPELSTTNPQGFREVIANYMVLEQGHLIFRNTVRGGYPVIVRAFAPGAWTTMERVEDGKTKTPSAAGKGEAVHSGDGELEEAGTDSGAQEPPTA